MMIKDQIDENLILAIKRWPNNVCRHLAKEKPATMMVMMIMMTNMGDDNDDNDDYTYRPKRAQSSQQTSS